MRKRARFLTPSEAGRVLGITASGVRWLMDVRRLRRVYRTETGRRFVLAQEVHRLAERRRGPRVGNNL